MLPAQFSVFVIYTLHGKGNGADCQSLQEDYSSLIAVLWKQQLCKLLLESRAGWKWVGLNLDFNMEKRNRFTFDNAKFVLYHEIMLPGLGLAAYWGGLLRSVRRLVL